jgi:hypothetical protein
MTWETVSYIATGVTFIYTIGKDFALWVFSLFNPYKSSMSIRFKQGKPKMALSVTIKNDKEEFLITEEPEIKLTTGFRFFNNILFEKSLNNKKYILSRVKSEKDNSKKHILEYDLSLLDFINFSFYKRVYVSALVYVDSEPDPKTFVHSLNRMLKHKTNKENIKQYTENTKNRFNHSVNYKQNLTPEEIQNKYGFTPQDKETE